MHSSFSSDSGNQKGPEMNKHKVLSKKDRRKAAELKAKIEDLKSRLNLLLTIPLSPETLRGIASYQQQPPRS